MYEPRTYRRLHKGRKLVYFNVKVEQTDLAIGASVLLKDQALALVKQYRNDIKNYIARDPNFLLSLRPVKPSNGAPPIIDFMCRAALSAGVGPMAAVAGAVSEYVGRELLMSSEEVIVENGGDIFIATNLERKIAIYAGNSPLSEKIGIKIYPGDTPLGVCTSSGKVGHSLSFGRADAVVILSQNTALADAVATATGNLVKTIDDIGAGINFAKNIDGVEGVLIIVDDKLGAWGNVNLTKLS